MMQSQQRTITPIIPVPAVTITDVQQAIAKRFTSMMGLIDLSPHPPTL